MSTFDTVLTPTPAAGKGIPYTWFTKLRDSIDALKQGDKALDYLAVLQAEITTTGTVNDHNPGSGVAVRWNGASQLTVTGIVPHLDGDVRIYENITTAQAILFTHQGGGSTATNRLIVGSTSGQWIGPGGSIGVKYDGTTDRWRVLFVNPGTPIAITEAAGNYATDGTGASTWTKGAGTQLAAHFQHVGSDVTLALSTSGYGVSAGAPTYIKFNLPNGFIIGLRTESGIWINPSGGPELGFMLAASGEAFVRIYRTNLTNTWGTGNGDVRMTVNINIA